MARAIIRTVATGNHQHKTPDQCLPLLLLLFAVRPVLISSSRTKWLPLLVCPWRVKRYHAGVKVSARVLTANQEPKLIETRRRLLILNRDICIFSQSDHDESNERAARNASQPSDAFLVRLGRRSPIANVVVSRHDGRRGRCWHPAVNCDRQTAVAGIRSEPSGPSGRPVLDGRAPLV